MDIDAHAYNISVRRGEFEGETLFEARVRELPDLVEYGETYAEAYDLAIDAIETTAEMFAELGRALPAPLAPTDDYSGRVTLRLPKSLHRVLAEIAETEGVSLNQHIVNILTYYSGYLTGLQQGKSIPWQPEPIPCAQKPAATPRKLRVVSDSPKMAAGWI